MNYITTQEDIEILLQQTKVISYKLELLNQNMKVINYLEGNLISDNLSIDSTSNIRRTYNCELVVTNSSFLIGKNTNVWYDKLIRPYIGIKHQRSQTIKWYCLGTFLYTEMNYNYDCSTNTLSLTCKDMMCLLDDTRKGQLDQYKRIIKEGSDAREVIISLLNLVGITKYYIDFNINNTNTSTYVIPYDFTYETGTTVYTILNDLVTLYPGTQMYFDVDGVFHIDKMPTRNNELSILSDDILKQIVISENYSTTFTDVYNKIIIWGKVNEAKFYSTTVTMNNACYNVMIAEDKTDENKINWIVYDEYDRGDRISIRVPSNNISNPTININNLGELPIVYDNGKPIEPNLLHANEDYVFRIRQIDDTKQCLLLGQYQCYAEAYLTNSSQDTNPYAVIDTDNDLSIENIGTITKVLSGGEYDKIYTNDLTEQRAREELYNYTNLKESLTLTCLCIPFLDVNQKITYKSNTMNQSNDYLITSISCNHIDFTMTLTLNKFFPDYI